MKIDGKPTLSGTLIIRPGQSGTLDLFQASYRLIFNPQKTPQNVRFDETTATITFDGTDNPLGFATTIIVRLSNGQQAILSLVIYMIGNVHDETRVVHFTVI